MCLAIPGKIVRIDAHDPADPVAEVDYGIARKLAHLLYTPDAKVGDYVIVHAGFSTTVMGESEAKEALEYARQFDAQQASAFPPTPGAA